MAVLNILKSAYEGTLGQTVGARWKDKQTVRARVFSKAPPTELQTANVRAFERLNRLSSAIARVAFPYLDLSTKRMHSHNAVAQWLKPTVRNNKFEIENMSEVIPGGNDVVINHMGYDPATGNGWLDITMRPGFVPIDGSVMVVLIVDELTNVFSSVAIVPQTIRTFFHSPSRPGLELLSVLFVSEPDTRGHKIYNLTFGRQEGMNYSTEEQFTGMNWTDGRPIYQRTWNYTVPNTQATTALQTIIDPQFNFKILKQELNWSLGGNAGAHFAGTHSFHLERATFNPNNTITVYSNADNPGLTIFIGFADNNEAWNWRNSVIAITLWYVK